MEMNRLSDLHYNKNVFVKACMDGFFLCNVKLYKQKDHHENRLTRNKALAIGENLMKS